MATSEEYYFADDQYFNPQLQLESSEKKIKVEEELSSFRVNKSKVQELKSRLKQELDYGLQANPPRPSAYPMYNTFLTKFPTGHEVGDYLGMDIGGSNLRLIHLKLTKNESTGKYDKQIEVGFYDVPADVRKSTSDRFFGCLASGVKKFYEKQNLAALGPGPVPLGLSFSFGYDQLAINKGKIEQFGINTNIEDAYGKDPVELLQKSLDQYEVPVKVVALANDCTATLTYAKYLDQQTSVSLIQGSGTNVCYIEKVKNFGRIQDSAQVFGEPTDRFVINTEYCIMGDKGEMDFLRNKFDYVVDQTSFMPGIYVYEKLMGGAFLGEILRIVLVDLIKMGLLLDGSQITEQLGTIQSIQTADISHIEEEFVKNGISRQNAHVKTLFTRLGYLADTLTEEDSAIVVYAAQLISIRAGLLTAAAVSIFADHLTEESVVKVGCDGSLFRKHPKMSTLVNSFANSFSPDKIVEVFSAEQGSGIGVAMMAATVVCAK